MIDRDVQLEEAEGVLLRRVTRALPLVVLVIGLTVTAAAVLFVRSEAEAESLEKAELAGGRTDPGNRTTCRRLRRDPGRAE